MAHLPGSTDLPLPASSQSALRVVAGGVVLSAALGLAACAPALDWREVRVGAADSVALFPCKVASHARVIPLAGQQVKLTLHACQAGDATWGLAWTDVGDPARVGAALQGLQQAARMNLGQAQVQARPLTVKGQTPHPEAGLWSLEGRYPDGKPALGQVAVFSRGTVVFQATALGVSASSEAAQTFFDALRFGP